MTTVTMLDALHVLTPSKLHLPDSLMCLATNIRIQLNHKDCDCLLNKDPEHSGLQGVWGLGEIIECPGSFPLSGRNTFILSVNLVPHDYRMAAVAPNIVSPFQCESRGTVA